MERCKQRTLGLLAGVMRFARTLSTLLPSSCQCQQRVIHLPHKSKGRFVLRKANLAGVLMAVKAFLLALQSLSFVVLLFMLPSYLGFLKWNIPIISHSYLKSHDLLRTIKPCCFVCVPAQDTNQCLCPAHTQHTHSCQSPLSHFLGYQIDWHWFTTLSFK